MDDGHVAATFGAVEAALAAASPIVARLVMPMPTWHGHAQRSAGVTPWPPSGSGTVTCWRPWSPSTRVRHDFGTRYTRHDLPAQVQEMLAELAFVTGLDDIAAKLPAAERLLGELLEELG